MCDRCPDFDDNLDQDTDSIPDDCDNCPTVSNPGQEDNDGILEGNACCCGAFADGSLGNANCDTFGKFTLSDISTLIDHVYISKSPLCCPANGNVDGSGDGKITLSDITRLIDHVYISKDPTPACPVGGVPGQQLESVEVQGVGRE